MTDKRRGEVAVMAETARFLLTMAILTGLAPGAQLLAQSQPPSAASPTPTTPPDLTGMVGDLPAPLPDSKAPTREENWQPGFLRSMPQPPDLPQSLFQPAPPIISPPPDLERPYFQRDPLLDPPDWEKPGWFTSVQIDIVHPHFFAGQTKGLVPVGGRNVNVALGSARFNWTVAPRIELGYRLTSGFGEFSVADRGFYTDGTGALHGPAGNFTRTSHLGVNYTDMDYASREFTPWQNWGMKWRAGVRVAYTWFDTSIGQPFDTAAAGSGDFQARTVNYTVGAGPHFGLQLDRRWVESGLSFETRLDIADTFTRVRQRFSAATTTLTPAGNPSRGEFLDRFWQQVPILNFQVGLGWQPPSLPRVRFFLGYVYEFWWQVGTNSNTQTTHGFFDNQGVVIRASYEF
jgi:hypothetical protein